MNTVLIDPKIAIDVRHKPGKLKDSTVDTQIRVEFERNDPANTQAFALVISNTILQFNSDAQVINVVFLAQINGQRIFMQRVVINTDHKQGLSFIAGSLLDSQSKLSMKYQRSNNMDLVNLVTY